MTKSKRTGNRRQRSNQAGVRPGRREAPKYIDDPLQHDMERFVVRGGTEEAWHILHASLHKAAKDAEEALPAAYEELRSLIAKTDPIVLYGAIDVSTQCGDPTCRVPRTSAATQWSNS